ncbi:ATP-binding protein [Geoalkalibacter sp.]|uniref:ATP-binding protein n=1 Tax=Geoalkalibacter sp. TaxID=3041440 RepID=UPI00272E8852|nr:ATP-binding protein [Geoalkalibacter sp.]
MNRRDHRRTIMTLVWILASIGLLSGALTNSLVGWTLLSLNRERIQMLEQDRQLGQLAARLQRLGQEARGEIGQLLQGNDPGGGPSSAEAFVEAVGALHGALGDSPETAALAELQAASRDLAALRDRAAGWLARYQPVAADQQEKRTLGEVRLVLEEMRAAAETLEGRQRLDEAIALRRWRQAPPARSAALAEAFLREHSQRWPRVLKEIRGELGELSRLVETLAGEDQIDHLADLRDNQLKPSLERLERQLLWLAEEDERVPGLDSRRVAELRDLLFGRGHAIVQEYQTIRLGEGGLFRLSGDALLLRQEREGLQGQAQELFTQVETIHPLMADLAAERGAAISRQAEVRLRNGLLNLLALSVLVMAGFLGLGWLISRGVETQVRTMARLRRDKELLLNSAGEGILGLDAQGRASFINPVGARLLGRAAEDLIGRDAAPLLFDAPGAAPLAPVLAEGRAVHAEDRFLRADGTPFPGEYTATPMRNEKGEIEGAVITFLDVTERKQAAAALERSYAALDELNRDLEAKVAERTRDLEAKNLELVRTQEELVRKEKLAAIGLLAAGVAHEINNPAAIIRGNGEILRRRLAREEREDEEVREILKHTERISRITQSLLLFAREQAQPPAPPEDVAIQELLDDILAQVSHQVDLAGVEIVRDYQPDPPVVRADREKLRQVFTNLILNAAQAMAGRGRLRLSIRRAGAALEIQVADSGPGIPAEAQALIFNPFFTTKKDGTGLGLAVSYGIVQALGGRIELVGAPGEGAVFSVHLPCA